MIGLGMDDENELDVPDTASVITRTPGKKPPVGDSPQTGEKVLAPAGAAGNKDGAETPPSEKGAGAGKGTANWPVDSFVIGVGQVLRHML